MNRRGRVSKRTATSRISRSVLSPEALYSKLIATDRFDYVFNGANRVILENTLYTNGYPNMTYYTILKRFIMERPASYDILGGLDSIGLSNEIIIRPSGQVMTGSQADPINIGRDTPDLYKMLEKINRTRTSSEPASEFFSKSGDVISFYNTNILFYLQRCERDPDYIRAVERQSGSGKRK